MALPGAADSAKPKSSYRDPVLACDLDWRVLCLWCMKVRVHPRSANGDIGRDRQASNGRPMNARRGSLESSPHLGSWPEATIEKVSSSILRAGATEQPWSTAEFRLMPRSTVLRIALQPRRSVLPRWGQREPVTVRHLHLWQVLGIHHIVFFDDVAFV